METERQESNGVTVPGRKWPRVSVSLDVLGGGPGEIWSWLLSYDYKVAMEPGKWLKAYGLCKVDGGVGEYRRSQVLQPDSSRKQCFSIVWEQGSVNLAAMGFSPCSQTTPGCALPACLGAGKYKPGFQQFKPVPGDFEICS